MRLVLISDTHSRHQEIELPEGDILVHAGDLTMSGRPEDIALAGAWLAKQPYEHVVVVAGNHDWLFENNPARAKKLLVGTGEKITYLENESVTLGGLKFWGSPITPRFLDWAFNCDRADIGKYWDGIPGDTDVLITHGPPLGICDQVESKGEHLGCFDLHNAVKRVEPKVHVFGHIHGGYGKSEWPGSTKFFNASIVNERYQAVNRPWVVDVDGRKQ